jgi:hypothetical protein
VLNEVEKFLKDSDSIEEQTFHVLAKLEGQDTGVDTDQIIEVIQRVHLRRFVFIFLL